MSAVLERYRTLVNQREAARLALSSAESALATAQQLSETAEQVRVFFSVLSEDQRKQLEQKVQGLVDYGVRQVFGDEYRFLVKSELRGKAVRTEFFMVSDGVELPILDAKGGGIGDVVSFLLRVVMLCLTRPAQRRLLILDEPFKFVSAGHFAKLETLLTELTEALDLQIVMVTHRLELVDAATTVVRVSQVDGVSRADIQQMQDLQA